MEENPVVGRKTGTGSKATETTLMRGVILFLGYNMTFNPCLHLFFNMSHTQLLCITKRKKPTSSHKKIVDSYYKSLRIN